MSVHWRFYPRVCWGNRRQREHWLVAAASFLLPSMLSRSELSPHIKLLNGFQYKHFFADLLLLLFLCFGISHRSGLALFLPFFCHLKLNEHSNHFFSRQKAFGLLSNMHYHIPSSECECHMILSPVVAIVVIVVFVVIIWIWLAFYCLRVWVFGPPNLKSDLKHIHNDAKWIHHRHTHGDFSV